MNGFKMAILPPMFELNWPERIRAEIPGATVNLFVDQKDAMNDIMDVDCAFGEVGPELFARAKRIRWIQSPAAGPVPSFFHEALVKSDVVVTNFRGIYNDHVGAHAMALILALARHQLLRCTTNEAGMEASAASCPLTGLLASAGGRARRDRHGDCSSVLVVRHDCHCGGLSSEETTIVCERASHPWKSR